MKCQRCPKQATLHITDIPEKGRYEEAHLCEDCAKKYLVEPPKAGDGNAASATELAGAEAAESLDGPACEACGITYLEFRNQLRFGCPHDYDTFKAELLPLLDSIHGDVRHVGKTPRRLPRTPGTQVELTGLRRNLQQLVAAENYEEAARIRDRIRELENG